MTEYMKPGDLTTAREYLDEHGHSAKIMAGGQSLSLLLRQNLLDPGVIIDISEVPELSGVVTEGNRVQIGAATTYSSLKKNSVCSEFPLLRDSVGEIADIQVRNVGTVGGAISHADPSLDIVPPLLCLDATIHIGSTDQERAVPLSEFHNGYMETALSKNELVEGISFENASDGWESMYTKHSNIAGGWPAVGIASRVRLTSDESHFESVQLAAAAVADTAIRLPSVEDALTGEPVESAVIADAAERATEDIDPLDDIAGTAPYKEHLSKVLVERNIKRTLGGQRNNE